MLRWAFLISSTSLSLSLSLSLTLALHCGRRRCYLMNRLRSLQRCRRRYTRESKCTFWTRKKMRDATHEKKDY
jgi:hypothetical protein